MRILITVSFVGLLLFGQCWAGEVQIVDVRAKQSGETWLFSVTLKHADSGWEHYADAWRVVDAQGETLGTRTLLHPHVNEQPFTRSLDRVVIKDWSMPVYIEAHDNLHGWSAQRFEVRLQQR